MQQQQQQHQQGQKPKDGDNPPAGQNAQAKQAAPDDGKEVAERVREVTEWGHLPDYLGAIKQRGGVPEVSEKYRRLYDAYLKAQAKKPAATNPPK